MTPACPCACTHRHMMWGLKWMRTHTRPPSRCTVALWVERLLASALRLHSSIRPPQHDRPPGRSPGRGRGAACRRTPAPDPGAARLTQLSPTTTAVISSCMGPLRRHRSRAICAILSEAACGVLALAAMATASDDETWSHTPSEPKMSTWSLLLRRCDEISGSEMTPPAFSGPLT